jgi:hypothetical protein
MTGIMREPEGSRKLTSSCTFVLDCCGSASSGVLRKIMKNEFFFKNADWSNTHG